MHSGPAAQSGPINLGQLLDDAPWSRLQRNVLSLAALAVILDGFDNQLLGFIVPALIRDWGLDRTAFVPLIAASLIAMSVGTAMAGRLGDRVGRRPALIGSVTVFGLATLASAASPNLMILGVLRCIAALGLGGAMPNAAALLAEYAPARRRSVAVTLGIVCVPLGGFLGGIAAAMVLPDMGWRALLGIGGIVPLAAAVLMWRVLPESPRFLARTNGRDQDLLKILRNYDPAIDVARGFVAEAVDAQGRPSGSIFAIGVRRDTFVLWVAFFFCLLAVYSMFNWAPTMLTQAGLGLATASSGLAAFNFGGILGALIGAFLMDRLGSRLPMVAMACGGALCSVVASYAVASGSEVAAIASLAAQGAFVAGLQVMLFALAANVYPAASRATGVGAALAVGRLGAVISSLAGSAMLSFGSHDFLLFVAASMIVTGVALVAIKRHTNAGTAGSETGSVH